MARGTLGQQSSALRQSSRITRTERKRQTESQRIAQINFNLAQAEASRLQTDVFVDKPVTETYYEYVPEEYVYKGEISRAWRILSEKDKAVLMQGRTPQNLVAFARTRQVNDPFTFEEYKTEYQTLRPDVKQFFSSPQKIIEEKSKTLQTQRGILQTRISNTQDKITQRRKRLKEKKEWWNRQSERFKSNEGNRERYEKKLKDYNIDIEYFADIIKNINSQSQNISTGATSEDILDFAEDKAQADREKKQLKSKIRSKFKIDLKTGKIDAEIVKLGLNKATVKYSDFVKGIEDYNKDIEYTNTLVKWSEEKGFGNLPDYAKERLNPKAVEWQKANPTEKIIYDKEGNIWGIDSAILQQSVSLKEYNRLASRTPDDYYQEALAKSGLETEYVDPVVPVDPTIEIHKNMRSFGGQQFTFTDFTKEDLKQQGHFSSTRAVELSGGKVQDFKFTFKDGVLVSATPQGQSFIKTEKMKDPLVTTIPTEQDKEFSQNFGLDYFTSAWKEFKGDLKKIQEHPLNPDITVGFGGIGSKGYTAGEFNKNKLAKFIGSSFRLPLADVTKGVSDVAGQTSEDLSLKVSELAPNKAEIEKQFQQEYQDRFDKAYLKKIIYGEIDHETASKEFADSETAKIISGKYGTAISEDTKRLPLSTKLGYGTRIAGLELGKKVVDFVPTDAVDLAVKGIAVKTTFNVLGKIPMAVSLVASAGFFTYGTYKAFSPKSTPVEAGAGLITATISGATLGYAGYKWWRSPKLIYKDINPRKASLHSGGSSGKDLKITVQEKTFNKVLFGKQKLSQTAGFGRRTIVSTKGAELNRNFWKMMGIHRETTLNTGLGRHIYEGVPSYQPAIYGTDVFRGTKFKIKLSGHEQAMKRLTEYGWTKAQATATLRYHAPQYVEKIRLGGQLDVYKDLTAKGKFVFETRKPAITVNERLGIKTRGGRVVRDVVDVNRKIIVVNEKQLMLETKSSVSKYLSGNKPPVQFQTARTISVSSAKTSDLKQGYEFLSRSEGFNTYQPAHFKDISSVSREIINVKLITKTGRMPKWEINTRDVNLGDTRLFNYDIDLSTPAVAKTTIIQEGTKVKPYKYTQKDIKEMIKALSGQDAVKIEIPKSPQADISGVIQKQQLSQLAPLKTAVIPKSVELTKLTTIPKVATTTIQGIELGVASAVASRSIQATKQNLKLKTQLRQMSSLKVNQLTEQLLKQDLKVQQVTKVVPSLKLQPQLNIPPISPINPIVNPPRTIIKPPPTTTLPKFAVIFAGDKLKEKIKAKKKAKQIEKFALLPDFTSRAIGLKPKEFGNVSDAIKEIKNIKTGLEIRRGGRIKGYSSINEKQLMAGIMK